MMVVWKYRLPEVDAFVVEMPEGATVLSVQEQAGQGPQMWALCDPDNRKTSRRFFVLGTGHLSGVRKLGRFIGTFQLGGGDLVFHLFEEA